MKNEFYAWDKGKYIKYIGTPSCFNEVENMYKFIKFKVEDIV